MSKPTATKFEHAGVEITLLNNGKFSATVQGNKTVKQSLNAMKKHIDAQKKAAFTTYFAIVKRGYGMHKAGMFTGRFSYLNKPAAEGSDNGSPDTR